MLLLLTYFVLKYCMLSAAYCDGKLSWLFNSYGYKARSLFLSTQYQQLVVITCISLKHK